MAKYVYEVMNREVLSVAPSHPTRDLHRWIISLGITAVPVIDEEGTPVGMVSLRDLLQHPKATTAEEAMSRPAVVVDQGLPLETAARLLSAVGLHRLVCTNDEGRVAGIVSAVDLLRGCLGLPHRHPDAFPHYDRETSSVWTDDVSLDLDSILAEAPDGPGVLVLIHGGRNRPETVVWAEAVESLAGRLLDLVSTPQPPTLRRLLELGNLRFRAARAENDQQREVLLQSVARLGTAAHHPS